jgi:outer membrane protein OmpA-like peptidoglycan-associated protein
MHGPVFKRLLIVLFLLLPATAVADQPQRLGVVQADALFVGSTPRLLATATRTLTPYLPAMHRGQVILSVHTDRQGSTADNLALSMAQGKRLKELLTGLGVPAYRIRLLGYGEVAPVDRSGTAAGERRNRRVELWLGALR